MRIREKQSEVRNISKIIWQQKKKNCLNISYYFNEKVFLVKKNWSEVKKKKSITQI